ncbi:uncharacterized protein LOC132191915 isoform X2 [Corylus avellana]|uniref:uncharacterized protein LOC132191915 isoform X2 n=1 Tax=Corylus avellana TaxID=13451 RepID=UPI00286D019F|nr:uncharacterized protein LOC132191915 isoform X2 [Corylus avellana]
MSTIHKYSRDEFIPKRRKTIYSRSRSSLNIRTTTPRVDTSARPLCTAAGPPAGCFSYDIVFCVSGIRTATDDDGTRWTHTKWYTISVQADGRGKVYPKRLRHFWKGMVPTKAPLATLGPHVYSFGGVNISNPSSREIRESYRLRFTPQVGKEFVPVSPMLYGRSVSEISVLGNKIYLRNSFSQTPPLLHPCWGEVFDVDNGKWEALPNPPNYPFQYPESIVVSAVVENPERVIVAYRPNAHYSFATFYAYNVRHRSWGRLAPAKRFLHKLICDSWPGSSVSAGNTLYWIKREEALSDDMLFIAYDLDLNMWLEGCLKGHGRFFYQDYGILDEGGRPPRFFHLEKQRFCLLQFSDETDYIRCVVVHVSPMPRMKTLDIEVVCDQKYAMERTTCAALAFCNIVREKIDLEEKSTNKEFKKRHFGEPSTLNLA